MRTGVVILFLVCLGAALAQSEAEFNKEVEIYRNAQDKFCWKNSYGRGVGLIPKDCGSEKEYDAGLCYKPCRSGYKGVGPVCWDFPKSYGRGVGTIPKSCQNSKQYDAGLCYPYCKDTFYGVGPVCWKTCTGSTPVNCGAACGSSAGACARAIFNMVKSVLNMIKDLAKLIFSSGASLAKIGQDKGTALQAGFDLAKLFIKKGYTKAAYINLMTKEAQKIGVSINVNTLEMLFEKASIRDLIRLELEIIAQTDPTGIANVILAFLQDVC